MKKVIKVNPLDTDSIERAIKELKEQQLQLNKKAESLVRLLTQLGLEKARDLCPVDTGVAQNSIIAYMDEADGTGIIRAGGYCKYIEFGTGVKGKNGQHPSPEYMAVMQWAYNVGAFIFTTKDGREGWFYPADDGSYRFTQGMPSRPFMYETAEYLKKEAKRMAREVLNG